MTFGGVLEVDKSRDAISGREAGKALPVLPDPADQIVRHAYIQGAVAATGGDVDAIRHTGA
jgi:hypothetical protein